MVSLIPPWTLSVVLVFLVVPIISIIKGEFCAHLSCGKLLASVLGTMNLFLHVVLLLLFRSPHHVLCILHCPYGQCPPSSPIQC